MKKLFKILLVGLAFLALNVGTLAAQTGMLPMADDSSRPIGEGGEAGGPAATDMSDKMINDGGHGANSGLDMQQAIDKCVKGAKTVYKNPESTYEKMMVEQCKNGNGKCYFDAKSGILPPRCGI